MSVPSYIVGIDLGTTHCALAYAPIADAKKRGQRAILPFATEQLVAPGIAEARPLLPSAIYLPSPHELDSSTMALPFGPTEPTDVVGTFAQVQGAKVPGRIITSAKSWLCHGAVDRQSAILPAGAANDVRRISPVAASARYLMHLRDAWNHRFPDAPLQEQEVVLAVPASFDASARSLTLAAAHAAHIDQHLVLIEEPQAAFYDYYASQQMTEDEDDNETSLVLVVDVGGGTTDLTLIQATKDSEGGPSLSRLAVGDHILLGGDNMDMTLARVAEQQMNVPGGRLDAARFGQLVQSCRLAKEAMLSGPDAPDTWTLVVPGRGSRLMQRSLKTEITREQVQSLVTDGFFPVVTRESMPIRKARTGLAQLGLPYESDTAITRHIASFLARHGSDQPLIPDAVLLNGGVFKSTVLRSRLMDIFNSWFGSVSLLGEDRVELAVARGAAAFGLVRHGIGARIGGGTPHAYYIGVSVPGDDQAHAACLIPRGHEPGTPVMLSNRTFELAVGRPVQFSLFQSSAARRESPGEVIAITDDEFQPLPPVQTLLEHGGGRAEIPVVMQSEVSEIGALQLACVAVDRERRWELEFDLRATPATAIEVQDNGTQVTEAQGFNATQKTAANEALQRIFGRAKEPPQPRDVRQLLKTLQLAVNSKREHWTLPQLRDLWELSALGAKRRRRSAEHEAVFFTLAGYVLRPGFGYPLDEWRVRELWSLHNQGVQYHQEGQVWHAWWVMWRRVVGGLSAEQQRVLLSSVGRHLRPELGPPEPQSKKKKSKRQVKGQEEMLRLVGALERIDPSAKAEWGEWILKQVESGRSTLTHTWALARLGARVPFSGAVHNVVDPDVVENWLIRIQALPWKKIEGIAFAAAHLARRTDDRNRDINGDARDRLVSRLVQANEPMLAQMVRDVIRLEKKTETRFIGDTLPAGLRLRD